MKKLAQKKFAPLLLAPLILAGCSSAETAVKEDKILPMLLAFAEPPAPLAIDGVEQLKSSCLKTSPTQTTPTLALYLIGGLGGSDQTQWHPHHFIGPHIIRA